MTKITNQTVYEELTQKLISILKNSKTLNWNRPWFQDGKLAENIFSKRKYRGLNQLFLSWEAAENFEFNRWLTFKQGVELGAKVIKGQKAQRVYYWNFLYFNGDTGQNITKAIQGIIAKHQAIPDNVIKKGFLKHYSVFNIAQFEKLPQMYFQKAADQAKTVLEKNEMAEQMIKETKAEIVYHSLSECFYQPKTDKIMLCKPEVFKGTEEYYSTLFHELGHWTGHQSRLDRFKTNAVYGSADYAKEELIAEFTAAFVCAEYGFSKMIQNSAAYLDFWLKALKNDVKLAFTAASKAQKAADYLFSLVQENKSKEQTLESPKSPPGKRRKKKKSMPA